MPIDKETIPTFVNVVMNDNKKQLDELRKQADEDSQNEGLEKGESKKLSFTADGRSVEVSEYYFERGSIYYSAEMSTESGKKMWFSFEIPLSDTVLIDILEYSCKKLNKLKTALETLK